MQRYRSLIIMGLLLVGAICAIYITSYQSSHTDTEIANDDITNDEDFFADNIQIVKYRQDGSLYYEMQSTHITHNDKNDVAFVTQPIMALHAAQNVRWNARADNGKVYNHQQAIDLTDNVIIAKHEKDNSVPALLLTTNNITLHPENNTFTTSDQVNIKTASTKTTATGMKASMDNNHIELLNNVRTYYEK